MGKPAESDDTRVEGLIQSLEEGGDQSVVAAIEVLLKGNLSAYNLKRLLDAFIRTEHPRVFETMVKMFWASEDVYWVVSAWRSIDETRAVPELERYLRERDWGDLQCSDPGNCSDLCLVFDDTCDQCLMRVHKEYIEGVLDRLRDKASTA